MRISRLSTKPDKRIFISWVKHTTRSASFAQAFGAECHFIDSGFSLGLLKYFPRGWRTLRLMWSRQPAAVICMNPPYFLGLLAWVYCLFHEAQFVLDSHTAAFDSDNWSWMGPLHRFIIRRAVCTTVTNRDLAEQVERQGGRAVVLSDIPYRMPEGSFQVEGDFSVCFVCNYAEDEPVLEVFAAAQELPDVHFYVSGDTRKAQIRWPSLRRKNRITSPRNTPATISAATAAPAIAPLLTVELVRKSTAACRALSICSSVIPNGPVAR